MRLYSGMSREFLSDVLENHITELLISVFKIYYGKQAVQIGIKPH